MREVGKGSRTPCPGPLDRRRSGEVGTGQGGPYAGPAVAEGERANLAWGQPGLVSHLLPGGLPEPAFTSFPHGLWWRRAWRRLLAPRGRLHNASRDGWLC